MKPELIAVNLAHRPTEAGGVIFIKVVGEQVAPGLAITPTLNDDGLLAGLWALTHVGSGMAVAHRGAACLPCTRKVARSLVRRRFDWTHGLTQMRGDEAVKAAALVAGQQMAKCLVNCATGMRS